MRLEKLGLVVEVIGQPIRLRELLALAGTEEFHTILSAIVDELLQDNAME